MKFVLLGLLALVPFLISAQGILDPHDAEGYHVSGVVVKGDTMAILNLDEVYIWGNKAMRNSTEARQWERLVRNVKKAYPYAKLAGIKFNEYNQKIASVKNEKVQKTMMKKAEDEIQAQFGNELKDLTITQGKILLKLIDRQTNNTSYDIVVDFRGRFRAFFYQSFARLFSYNLKVKYDPLGADADIERIVLMIESGSI
ncbi:MAG: DUF4294 domain-containing protein [Bacteroidales bacterium]|nr:DUF4294 domain-containing protein [Bacteroidales bacterium]